MLIVHLLYTTVCVACVGESAFLLLSTALSPVCMDCCTVACLVSGQEVMQHCSYKCLHLSVSLMPAGFGRTQQPLAVPLGQMVTAEAAHGLAVVWQNHDVQDSSPLVQSSSHQSQSMSCLSYCLLTSRHWRRLLSCTIKK